MSAFSASAFGTGDLRANQPRLVVLIVVDQLRYDLLERYRPFFVDGGFERLLAGANFSDANHTHATTDTCPGHAVIATGSLPNSNGIVANAWFDADLRRPVYCVENGHPEKLYRPTIGDLLKQQKPGGSRVVGIAGKEESAVLMAGHSGDAAFWLSRRCRFVSSPYYALRLGDWAHDFASGERARRFAGATWDRSAPGSAYESIGLDDQPGEVSEDGLGRTFPNSLPDAGKKTAAKFCSAFRHTPFANDVVAEFVMEAIAALQLGQRDTTDLLAVGFSAIDAVGHRYGPDSHEMLDAILRLDRLFDRFIDFLQRQVGADEVLIVLTADHGVAPLPEIPRPDEPDGGHRRVPESDIVAVATHALDDAYGPPASGRWVAFHDYPNIYLNEQAIRDKGIAVTEAERVVKRNLRRVHAIKAVFTRTELRLLNGAAAPSELAAAVLAGFRPERSGNVVYHVRPYHLVRSRGTNHGTSWTYDRHVPLIWYGTAIRPGRYDVEAGPVDIVPTLADILGMTVPGTDGRVLHEILY